MKAIVLGATLALASVGLGLASPAHAATPNGRSYYFYSGTQLIGQSILFCSNITQHWGSASGSNLTNTVSISYPCSSNAASYVGYGSGIDPIVKANFCNTVDACADGPNFWNPDNQPIVRGLYSD